MTSPNANATAEAVANKLDGLDGNGNAEPFDQVAMLYDAHILGLAKDYALPEGPNVSASAIDHITTLAKILTRKVTLIDGNSYDVFDMLATCTKWVLSQNAGINNDEINSVGYKGKQ